MRLPLLRSLVLAAALSLAPSAAFAQVFVVPSVRVAAAPPPLRVEVQPAAPSAAHVWIAGHWGWRNGAHEWIGGHWALPPESGYVWEPVRWVNEGGGWTYYAGHWRLAAPPAQPVIYQPAPAPAQPIVTETAPPEPIVEVRPASPWANALWIPGYWHWNGYRHVWASGRWSAPHPGHVWEPHRWERDGNHWRFVVGRWR